MVWNDSLRYDGILNAMYSMDVRFERKEDLRL
jgi:hypothetical protein